MKDALARMTRAQAAVDDLTPAFNHLIAGLVEAAKKLDPEKPVDIANAIRDDTTREKKTAQSAVDSLGVFAAIHVSAAPGNPPALHGSVLPILDLPDCRVELIAKSVAGQTPNKDELAGTHTVRELARALERGVDNTLVKIARGAYTGITFMLHDRASDAATLGHARRAFTRKRATAEQTQSATRVGVTA